MKLTAGKDLFNTNVFCLAFQVRSTFNGYQGHKRKTKKKKKKKRSKICSITLLPTKEGTEITAEMSGNPRNQIKSENLDWNNHVHSLNKFQQQRREIVTNNLIS